MKPVGMDISPDDVDGDIHRMAEQKNDGQQYGFDHLVAGNGTQQVDDIGNDAGAQAERQQARIGKDIAEITRARVVEPV